MDRRLAAPALFLLESSKPLSFLASQGLVFLGPFVDAALDVPSYDAVVRMLEDRDNVERLLQRIEHLEDDRLSRLRRKKDPAPPDGEETAHGPGTH